MTEDLTFSETSLYGSVKWVAARLGRTYDWFNRHRKELEQQGFPKPDPLFKSPAYLKADVDAWVNRRRKLQDGDKNEKQGFNADAI